ncbi:MAG: hypothetical protein KatS3mg103_0770 [Phycisphaerales bacterium]|nr:MAG: hypothetical protein KatS3mg103_0770 [Phycisphaerales bacterium]
MARVHVESAAPAGGPGRPSARWCRGLGGSSGWAGSGSGSGLGLVGVFNGLRRPWRRLLAQPIEHGPAQGLGLRACPAERLEQRPGGVALAHRVQHRGGLDQAGVGQRLQPSVGGAVHHVHPQQLGDAPKARLGVGLEHQRTPQRRPDPAGLPGRPGTRQRVDQPGAGLGTLARSQHAAGHGIPHQVAGPVPRPPAGAIDRGAVLVLDRLAQLPRRGQAVGGAHRLGLVPRERQAVQRQHHLQRRAGQDHRRDRRAQLGRRVEHRRQPGPAGPVRVGVGGPRPADDRGLQPQQPRLDGLGRGAAGQPAADHGLGDDHARRAGQAHRPAAGGLQQRLEQGLGQRQVATLHADAGTPGGLGQLGVPGGLRREVLGHAQHPVPADHHHVAARRSNEHALGAGLHRPAGRRRIEGTQHQPVASHPFGRLGLPDGTSRPVLPGVLGWGVQRSGRRRQRQRGARGNAQGRAQAGSADEACRGVHGLSSTCA